MHNIIINTQVVSKKHISVTRELTLLNWQEGLEYQDINNSLEVKKDSIREKK
jgi:hypothetical protein